MSRAGNKASIARATTDIKKAIRDINSNLVIFCVCMRTKII